MRARVSRNRYRAPISSSARARVPCSSCSIRCSASGKRPTTCSWKSFEHVAAHPLVAWAIPLSLGDSHRGFSVVGTSKAYFEHFRYSGGERLTFASGKPFESVFEAVLGAEVAERLGYVAGERIVLNHGTSRRGRRARGQAVHRRRHARAHRNAGRSLRACAARRHRSDAPRLAGRRADSGRRRSHPST